MPCECMSENGIFVWQIAQLQSRIHLCLITSLMCERYVDWHKRKKEQKRNYEKLLNVYDNNKYNCNTVLRKQKLPNIRKY